jgi:hypothetical protein
MDGATPAIEALHQTSRRNAAQAVRNATIKSALGKCAGQSYANPAAAKLALVRELLRAGIDAEELNECRIL